MPYDDKSELFYWVDENDQVLGSITRREAHSGTRKIHRSIYVLLINDKDEILMQKRSQNKDTFPGFWTISTSGHVTYPDSYEQAAKKEVKEEIGLDIGMFEKVGQIFYESDQEKEIGQIYKARHLGEEIKIDMSEVEKVEWVKLDNLNKWVKANPITLAAKQVLKKCKFI